MDLGLVSCAKSKRDYRCKASEMYSPSTLFRKAYSYALKKYDVIVILSAKYGLLLPDDEIDPYELTLKRMDRKKRMEWSDEVFKHMKERLDIGKINRAFFHAGKEYREFLISRLEGIGIQCIVPIEGLSLGGQLAWYSQ